jgi:hypothetical protein
MRRVLIAATLLTTGLAAAPADAAVRTGTSSEGLRFRLDGRVLTLRSPANATEVQARCGRESLGRRRIARAIFRGRYRRGERLRVRLGSDVSRTAEWCGVEAIRGGRLVTWRAATLRPRVGRPPRRLREEPGVRVGRSRSGDGLAGRGGDAVFLLDRATVTVRLRRALRRSALVTVTCFASDGGRLRQLAYRTRAAARGQRSITVGLERDVEERASACLVERFGRDIAGARLRAP